MAHASPTPSPQERARRRGGAAAHRLVDARELREQPDHRPVRLCRRHLPHSVRDCMAAAAPSNEPRPLFGRAVRPSARIHSGRELAVGTRSARVRAGLGLAWLGKARRAWTTDAPISRALADGAGRRRWPTALADGALAMRSGVEDAASGSAVGWRGGAGSRLSRRAMWRWAALADGSEVERVGEDRGEQELRDVRREPLAPLQRAACDARHAICNMRSATCIVEHATRDLQHATAPVECRRQSTHTQHATRNMQHATCNTQHAAAQHAAAQKARVLKAHWLRCFADRPG